MTNPRSKIFFIVPFFLTSLAYSSCQMNKPRNVVVDSNYLSRKEELLIKLNNLVVDARSGKHGELESNLLATLERVNTSGNENQQ